MIIVLALRSSRVGLRIWRRWRWLVGGIDIDLVHHHIQRILRLQEMRILGEFLIGISLPATGLKDQK